MSDASINQKIHFRGSRLEAFPTQLDSKLRAALSMVVIRIFIDPAGIMEESE